MAPLSVTSQAVCAGSLHNEPIPEYCAPSTLADHITSPRLVQRDGFIFREAACLLM